MDKVTLHSCFRPWEASISIYVELWATKIVRSLWTKKPMRLQQRDITILEPSSMSHSEAIWSLRPTIQIRHMRGLKDKKCMENEEKRTNKKVNQKNHDSGYKEVCLENAHNHLWLLWHLGIWHALWKKTSPCIHKFVGDFQMVTDIAI